MLKAIYYYDVSGKFFEMEEVQRLQIFDLSGTFYGPYWIRGFMFFDLFGDVRIRFDKYGTSEPIYFENEKVVAPMKDGSKYVFALKGRPVYYSSKGRPYRCQI